MSLTLQAKLLRVLENNKIRRLGSNKDLQINVRVIAATNKDLLQAIEDKEFRNDLYYRINVLRILVPPLRKRGEDIILLAEYFMQQFKIKFSKKIEGFDNESKEELLKYNWTGNVRELRNVVERTCILQKSDIIRKDNLALELSSNMKKSVIRILEKEINHSRHSYEELIDEIESIILRKAIDECKGNVSEAARILKIPRETLRYKINKFKISTTND